VSCGGWWAWIRTGGERCVRVRVCVCVCARICEYMMLSASLCLDVVSIKLKLKHVQNVVLFALSYWRVIV